MKSGIKKDIYEVLNNTIIEKLESGNITQWTTGRKDDKGIYYGWNYNMISKKPYSFLNNFMLLWAQLEYNYKSNLWLTFNQIKDLGGDITGEKSRAFVVFYKMLEKEVTKDNGEKEIKEIPYISYSSVFNLDQTKNIDKNKIPETIEPEKIVYNSTDTEKAINRYCKMENIKQVHGGNQPCYIPVKDIIMMPLKESYFDDKRFYSTYFHEITHSTGNKKRLNREAVYTGSAKEKYAKEELVAEVGAAYLCCQNGIDQKIDNSISYIDNWKKHIKDNKYFLVSAFSQAEKACDFVMERMMSINKTVDEIKETTKDRKKEKVR